MRFGIFYEHQLPAALGRGRRGEAPDRRARAGRARRPGRHRLRLGGRAPLPRGVLALERARGVPRGRQPAHQEHPARPRHRADPARLQPPGARRRADRDARPGLRRPGRVRHRRVELAGRARRRSASTARPSASSGRSRSTRSRGCSSRSRSPATTAAGLSMPPRSVAAEAEAEAAPAAVGRVQPARDDPAGRAEGHRRAHVRVHRARAGASEWVDEYHA